MLQHDSAGLSAAKTALANSVDFEQLSDDGIGTKQYVPERYRDIPDRAGY